MLTRSSLKGLKNRGLLAYKDGRFARKCPRRALWRAVPLELMTLWNFHRLLS